MKGFAKSSLERKWRWLKRRPRLLTRLRVALLRVDGPFSECPEFRKIKRQIVEAMKNDGLVARSTFWSDVRIPAYARDAKPSLERPVRD